MQYGFYLFVGNTYLYSGSCSFYNLIQCSCKQNITLAHWTNPTSLYIFNVQLFILISLKNFLIRSQSDSTAANLVSIPGTPCSLVKFPEWCLNVEPREIPEYYQV